VLRERFSACFAGHAGATASLKLTFQAGPLSGGQSFTLLQERKLTQEASVFGGSFNVRKLRGSDRWSAHAWGAEIDIDPENNQFSWGPARFKMDRRVVRAFEEAGFYWRGHLGFDE
jgi:hypothetical protein